MKNAITVDRIANSIIQRRKKYDNYILVEGNHDRLFFLKFKNEQTQIEISFGWEKLIQIIKIVKERGYEKLIGVIDKDLREIIPITIETEENIILTDEHDINILTIEKSFNTIFQSYQSDDKVEKFESSKNICIKAYTYQIIRSLSYLKILNLREKLNLSFKANEKHKKNLDYSKFIDKEKYEFISLEKLVETVINYSRNRTKEKLLSNEKILIKLHEIIDKEIYNDTKLTSGHDFSEVICLGLKKALGTIDIDSELFLRENILNYELNDFIHTELFRNITDIEVKRGTKYLKL